MALINHTDNKNGQKYYIKYKSCDKSDFAARFQYASLSAEAGNPNGQWALGYMYHHGEGAAQDLNKAKFWYEKAAEQNAGIALSALGGLYEYSNFGAVDYNKAETLYIKAIECGDIFAKKHLENLQNIRKGIIYSQKGTTAEEYLNLGKSAFSKHEYQLAHYYMYTAAVMGDDDAMRHIGLSAVESTGCPVNLTKAVFWLYRSATEFNNCYSNYILAKLFHFGSGVHQNTFIALELYDKAFRNGHTLSKDCVKHLKKDKEKLKSAKITYQLMSPQKCLDKAKKLIFDNNPQEAYSYLYSAAMRGNAEAQNMLGVNSLTNSNEASCYPEAMYWLLRATYNGYPIAYENIALMFENGMGIDKDLNLAKTYYKKAADSGVATAAEKLKELN